MHNNGLQQNISLFTTCFRAAVYLFSMIYLFLGVSIVADRFMAAIEVITSQEREVSVKKPNGEKAVVLVRIWNETVSNLTLMALGSSAPEILLSVIEIFGNKFEAGDLGPGILISVRCSSPPSLTRFRNYRRICRFQFVCYHRCLYNLCSAWRGQKDPAIGRFLCHRCLVDVCLYLAIPDIVCLLAKRC